jgi:hypothetical protein
MTAVNDDRAVSLSLRIAALQSSIGGTLQRLEDSRDQLRSTRAQIRAGRSERELLHESAYARLQARLESLPVIEQAKGILMAQAGCGPDEAFDMLRRASQRTNVRVRDLAAEIVGRSVTRGRPKPPPGAMRRASEPGDAALHPAADLSQLLPGHPGTGRSRRPPVTS